jgi:hypothetical protein
MTVPQLDNIYLRQYFVNTGAEKEPNLSKSVTNMRVTGLMCCALNNKSGRMSEQVAQHSRLSRT